MIILGEFRRGFARLLAVALAKACIRAKGKRKPKHASGNLFRNGRMASANAGDKRLTASGVARESATTGCGVFCCSKQRCGSKADKINASKGMGGCSSSADTRQRLSQYHQACGWGIQHLREQCGARDRQSLTC